MAKCAQLSIRPFLGRGSAGEDREPQLTQHSGLSLSLTHSLTVCCVLQVERWTELALEVFSRHKEMNQYDHAPSDHTHSPEHQTMLSLGAEVERAMRQCTTRASGDNGQPHTHT